MNYISEQEIVKCTLGQLNSHGYHGYHLWKFSKTELEMSNRRDLIKIILSEMNKTFVPSVHIFSNQDEMDIAQNSYSFPKYGTGCTYIKITRSPECLLKNTDFVLHPRPTVSVLLQIELKNLHVKQAPPPTNYYKNAGFENDCFNT